ncbi:MAG: hypothetical protein PHD79_05215 [Aliarcobacter sp.]|jgi:hypothetical protein|nr:hypothetical protein [Aliarcobacter sp.]MDX9900163.1 hypothetical protein [Aliarcobacter sp.]
MFKKNICLIAILALFTGCVQKNVQIETYDLSNHWFNVEKLDNNKIIFNKNFTEQFNDGEKTSSYIDFKIYKKDKTNLNQIEQYSFFEDINKENYKSMVSKDNMDFKYNILINEIKESSVIDEKQISTYKRNIKINDNVIEESDIDGSSIVCSFSNYYENINTKDKINEFFKAKYSTKDKNYKNVIELSCKDSFVGEYYIYMAKNIGIVLFMNKDIDDGSLEETYSILDTQTIME